MRRSQKTAGATPLLADDDNDSGGSSDVTSVTEKAKDVSLPDKIRAGEKEVTKGPERTESEPERCFLIVILKYY